MGRTRRTPFPTCHPHCVCSLVPPQARTAASQTAKPGAPEKRGASPQGALRGSDTLGPLSPESTPFGAERHGHREHHTHAVRPHVAVSLGRARHDAGSPARSSVSRGGCAGRQAGRGPVPKTRCLEKILLPPSGPTASAPGGGAGEEGRTNSHSPGRGDGRVPACGSLRERPPIAVACRFRASSGGTSMDGERGTGGGLFVQLSPRLRGDDPDRWEGRAEATRLSNSELHLPPERLPGGR